MAQGNPGNLIEEHIEKIVLAVCGLLFLFGLFHWGFSSGTINGKPLNELDEGLRGEARSAKNRSDGAQGEKRSLPDYDGIIISLRNAERIRDFNPLGQFGTVGEVLEVGETVSVGGGRVELVDLLPLPTPGTPTVKGRLELPNTGEQVKDTPTCHGGALYPWRELVEVWEDKLRDTGVPAAVVVVSVTLEVQEKLRDGSWGDPRRVEVSIIPLEEASKQRWEELLKTIRSFDGKNIDEVRMAMQELQGWETQILTPPYWDIWDAKVKNWSDWKHGVLDDLVARVTPPEGEEVTPMKRAVRPVYTPRRRVTVERPITGPQRYRRMIVESDDRPLSILDDEEGRGPLWEMEREGSAVFREPTHKTVVPSRRVEDMVVPAIEQQLATGNVLMWFHDASLEELQVYRYRVRLELVNPLLSYIYQVRKQQDSYVATVTSPWSDWSGEVSVPKSTVFFLTGHNPAGGEVRVTVFTRSLGEPVKREFDVKSGERIGGEKEIMVINPVKGEGMLQKVNFFTGAIAVDFDFQKRIVKYRFPDKTVEMWYLDEKGGLRSRTRAADEDSQEYREWFEATRNQLSPGAAER